MSGATAPPREVGILKSHRDIGLVLGRRNGGASLLLSPPPKIGSAVFRDLTWRSGSKEWLRIAVEIHSNNVLRLYFLNY